MKIGIASDHAGFDMKQQLVTHLVEKGYEVEDFGTHTIDRVDYPDYAKLVANDVVNGHIACGILVCGTGIGMSIAANKVKGISAALVYNELTARLAKEHNHANIIAIGGRTQTVSEAKLIVDTYLNAHKESRHEGRIEKIAKIEEENL